MRDVTDDWRLVVECLNHVWWMTFCSLGELCESTFNCNIQMSYFALSGLILILFPTPCSVCGTLYVFSSFRDVMKHLWRPGQAGQPGRADRVCTDESDENTMSRAYVFTVTRAWGGRQTSSTRSDHKTNQRRTPSRHRQHSGTVSAAVSAQQGFDVSRLIVAQGLIALHFVHFLPAHSAHY